MNKELKELQSQTGTTKKYNTDDLKQIQENIHFIINNEIKQTQENILFIINKKGYGKKHFKRMQRLKKIKSFFHIFKKKELEHD